ncbi:MAG: superoxide dismutase family protein [Candidatus Eremiobacteraeota bacterium]|nr:superoxide dismutase family protein [Candidatus Eremiobacteraeota bacterium]MBV8353766.1 superoxide dismutase family protein [Candidatus Eremiobacteraeota bacterium]
MYRKLIGLSAGLVLACTLFPFSQARSAMPPSYVANIIDTTGRQVGIARFFPVAGGGTQIDVHVSGLPPGNHGLHIHEFGSCNALRDTSGTATPFGAAGGHFDPEHTGHHLGPEGGGHAGDLPMLTVDVGGTGGLAYYAPHLYTSGPNSIVGRSIVIHANPDNYTDTPPNGGSAGRIACGEIGAAT